MSEVDHDTAVAIEVATSPIWAREASRRTLLTHLGLTPLISRYDPAGAMPAQRLVAPISGAANKVRSPEADASAPDWVDPRSAALGEGQTTDSAPRLQGNSGTRDDGEMQGEQLRALLRDERNVQPPPIDKQQNASPSDTLDADATRAVERLSLLIAVTGDVLWIEQLDDHLLRKEQLHLVVAMARAIRGSAVRCEHQQFEWPPAGGLKLAHEGGLEDMLSGFLQRMVNDHQSQLVVQLGQITVFPALDLAVHRIPSSLTMLQQPSTKREAWAVLQSLALSPQ